MKTSKAPLFEKSLRAARDGDISLHLVLVRHPNANIISQTDHDPSAVRWGEGRDPYAAWRGPESPWLGAAVWIHPSHFDQDLMEARCGSLFSFTLTREPHLNEAFNVHLGPFGCDIGGAGSNPCAFERDQFPMPVSIAACDTRQTRLPREGQPRPDYWPEPYPLMRREWRPHEGPDIGPDFQAAALATARSIRAGAFEAMREEGVSESVIEALGGAICPVPGRVARLFARQEHPMFGASALSPEDRAVAMELFDLARARFEAERIDAATLHGSPAPKGARL